MSWQWVAEIGVLYFILLSMFNWRAATFAVTASWVRTRAETDKSVRTCDFFEGWSAKATDSELRGKCARPPWPMWGRAPWGHCQ